MQIMSQAEAMLLTAEFLDKLRVKYVVAADGALTVGGELDLRGTQITQLPEGLHVGGGLYLSGTQITQLPDNLTVGGWLDLSGTQITQLPEGLTVGGWLDLSGTQITQLPEGLHVGGWLDLSGTQITQLPDNLTVGGGRYLSGTQITQLPDNLTVGGELDLRGTQITQLPEGLSAEAVYFDGEISGRRFAIFDNIPCIVLSEGNSMSHRVGMNTRTAIRCAKQSRSSNSRALNATSISSATCRSIRAKRRASGHLSIGW
jgi:Leucine-rich repeat (LRR) protein